jgi:glycosyltransferase involved in cell wall biosynthesis
VVGAGPEEQSLCRRATGNVHLLGAVDDNELRWLYANATCLVAAAYEDFGLTPIEAAAFGTPTVALRFGGYMDTVQDGQTGLFFDQPSGPLIAEAITKCFLMRWDHTVIARHAERFSEAHFHRRLREIVTAGSG